MTRNDLYTAVWSDPVSHVARRIGMSDRGLIDICRAAEIPTPPRGFWRKVRTGQTPEKPALPRPEDDSSVPVDVNGALPKSAVAPTAATPMPTLNARAASELSASAEMGGFAKADWLELTPGETAATASAKGEYQKLLNLADAFDQHQLIGQLLDQIEASECKESVRTAAIMRRWVATMRHHHAKADPVEKVLADFRALSFSRQKPIWWDSM